jgi:hypothetical protein
VSDSNRIRVSVVAESSFGVIPTVPAWQVLATTGASMRDRVGYLQSRTINNDRNVLDLVRLSKAAGGQIPMELTWSPLGEGLSLLLAAAFASLGSDTGRRGIHPAASTGAGTKVITKDAGEPNFTAESVGVYRAAVVGDIVRITNAGADDGYYPVTVVADSTLTVEADANFTGDAACSVDVGRTIVNSTATTSFCVEIAWLDLQKAAVFQGCSVDSLGFAIADEAITTANFGFIGATSTYYETNNGTTDEFGPGTPTYTDPSVHPILDSLSVPEIRRGGQAYAAKSVSCDFQNNIAARTQIGTLGAVSNRYGEFGATGRIAAYFDDLADMIAYRDNTATDIWLAMIDPNGRGYTLRLPHLKFSDVGADARGTNQDILNEIAYTAIKDPVELLTAKLQRWGD